MLSSLPIFTIRLSTTWENDTHFSSRSVAIEGEIWSFCFFPKASEETGSKQRKKNSLRSVLG